MAAGFSAMIWKLANWLMLLVLPLLAVRRATARRIL
jgi:hypothetical protein